MDSMYLFILIVLALLTGGFLLLSLASRKKSKLDQSFFLRKWKVVEDKIEEEQYAIAVIEADKLLDEAMKQIGIKGETMGDRLKRADAQIRSIDKAWNAHKLRNKIVHETQFSLDKKQALQAIKDFKRSLNSLGVQL